MALVQCCSGFLFSVFALYAYLLDVRSWVKARRKIHDKRKVVINKRMLFTQSGYDEGEYRLTLAPKKLQASLRLTILFLLFSWCQEMRIRLRHAGRRSCIRFSVLLLLNPLLMLAGRSCGRSCMHL